MGPLSLHVAPGETVLLLGPPGAGKTRVLELLAGFATPHTGRIVLKGQDASDWPPHRRRAGFVERELGLFANMTVAQHLRIAAPHGSVQPLLDAAGLGGVARKRPAALRQGQRVRLAVARALAARPAILLLDDPGAQLGNADRRVLADMLRAGQEANQTAILWASARAEDGPEQADRIVVLVNGTTRQEGSPRTGLRAAGRRDGCGAHGRNQPSARHGGRGRGRSSGGAPGRRAHRGSSREPCRPGVAMHCLYPAGTGRARRHFIGFARCGRAGCTRRVRGLSRRPCSADAARGSGRRLDTDRGLAPRGTALGQDCPACPGGAGLGAVSRHGIRDGNRLAMSAAGCPCRGGSLPCPVPRSPTFQLRDQLRA